MKSFKKAGLMIGLIGLLACGCATKKIDTTEVPNSPEEAKVVVVPTPMPTASQEAKVVVPTAIAPTPVVEQRYVVRKGDTLWAISQQNGIYSDPFQWPLIFKTNRDEIQDPDEIEVGEVLLIQKGESTDQIKHARQLASDTPVFVAHANPRKPLPIDYF